MDATISFPLDPHRRATTSEVLALSFIIRVTVGDAAQDRFTVHLTQEADDEIREHGYLDRTEDGIRFMSELIPAATFTVESTEGSHDLCNTYDGATLTHAGWLAFVQAARLDGPFGPKVWVVIEQDGTSLRLSVEIAERFTTLREEISQRASVIAQMPMGIREAHAPLAKGYAWAQGVLD